MVLLSLALWDLFVLLKLDFKADSSSADCKNRFFQLNKISKTLNSLADSLPDLDCHFHTPSQHLHHLNEFIARPSQVWFSSIHQVHPFHSDILPSPQFLREGHAYQNSSILLSQNNMHERGLSGLFNLIVLLFSLAGVSQYWNLFPSDHSAWA